MPENSQHTSQGKNLWTEPETILWLYCTTQARPLWKLPHYNCTSGAYMRPSILSISRFSVHQSQQYLLLNVFFSIFILLKITFTSIFFSDTCFPSLTFSEIFPTSLFKNFIQSIYHILNHMTPPILSLPSQLWIFFIPPHKVQFVSQLLLEVGFPCTVVTYQGSRCWRKMAFLLTETIKYLTFLSKW